MVWTKGGCFNIEVRDKNIEGRDYMIHTLDSGPSELNLSACATKKISQGYVTKPSEGAGRGHISSVPSLRGASYLDHQKMARLKVILELKMENVFHPHSYGFNRPERSVHDALSVIQRMTGISWMIEGDIELKNFTGVHRHRLTQIFSQYIKPDQTLMNFYRMLYKLRYLELPKFQHYLTGVLTALSPWRSEGADIIYPLFANLFLTPFDEYTDKLKKEFFNLPVSNNSSLEGMRVERNISYVRYGNKFILGLSCSYNESVLVRDSLKDFLAKELDLTLNKDKIIHLSSNNANFLGYYLRITSRQVSYSQYLGRNANISTKRLSLIHSTRTLELIVPKKVVKEWLIYKGLADQQGRPKYVGKWIYLSDGEIIQRFNNIIVGLINYYKMGENRRDLNEAIYIIKYSLLHTIGAKHRMTLNKVIEKYTIDKVDKKLGVKLEGKARGIITFNYPKSLSASYLDEKYTQQSPKFDPFLRMIED
jgi:hypothetical protein